MGITAKKAEDFPEWYSQAVIKSGLVDYGPVHGTTAFAPQSYALWENIQDIFNAMIKKSGHKNAYFPLLIPEGFLSKEAEHFKGFVPEIYWVTHNGSSELKERLAIRPTSETMIYYFMARWIRSWRDLPMLLNQWCNILRAEIKDTKPFVRTSEFLWQEGHTAHATDKEAEEEVMRILEYYRTIVEDYIAVPVLMGRKSELEKFAGAKYTLTIEAMMPDGKAIQMATSHHLGQNFSKPFGIKFLGQDSKEYNVWTTSWGISTRTLGALVMVHGDDKGLVIPPRIADVHVVIIPIFTKDNREEVLEFCEEIKRGIGDSCSTVLDSDENTSPGYKFNAWELKGVPLRLEAGQRDMEKHQVTLVRRDNGQKSAVDIGSIREKVAQTLDDIQKSLYSKAREGLAKSTHEADTYAKFRELAPKGGFIKAQWCGKDECELKIKEDTTATSRLIPFNEKKKGACIVCGSPTETIVYFARAY